MSSFSNISIVGNLTRDPQLYIFKESGRKKTTMTVAVNNWIKTKDNNLEKTADFYKVETWDTLAQLTKDYLTKGSQVAVSGRLQMESWLDKEGKNRVTPTVKANQIALPQKNNSKAPDASAVSKPEVGEKEEAQAAGADAEGDEFDLSEVPPSLKQQLLKQLLLREQQSKEQSSQTTNANYGNNDEYLSNDEYNEDHDADGNEPDVEISESRDFSYVGSSAQKTQHHRSPFDETSKVVETTMPNSPASIARSA